MINFDLQKFIKMLYQIGENNNNISNITPFSSYEEIYFKSNENMHEYDIENLTYKNVLTVTSSGDHALYAILKGATNITCFDINKYTKLYSNLKNAMIKAFDYEDFIKYLILFKDNGKIENVFGNNILNKVKDYLTDEEILFWVEYDKFCIQNKDNFENSIFVYDDNDFSFVPYNTKKNYNLIKDRINDVKIKYIDSNISDLSNNLKNIKFDYIFLSNILSYVFDKDIFSSIIDNMFSILDENGRIYLFDLLKNATLPNILYYEQNNLDKEFASKCTKDAQNLYVIGRK